MRLWLAVTLIVFYVNSINAGLSPEERDKLIKAINKDREDIGKKHNFKFPLITYDVNLEKYVESKKCTDDKLFAIKGNNVLREASEGLQYDLFRPKAFQIGCSKITDCSFPVELGPLAGKTAEIYVACTLRKQENVHQNLISNISTNEFPSPFKYGDLIGSASNSSGIVFSLILSLLLFYV